MATILQVSSSPRLKGRLWITRVALRRRLGVVLEAVLPLVGVLRTAFLRCPVGLGAGRFRVGVRRGVRW